MNDFSLLFFSVFTLFSVPILPLSRHSCIARSFFCPDSPTIETQLHCSFFFLSRFCHYRDTVALLALFSVPILPLSRLILAARSFFCPDSPTIETHFGCPLFFLSRFAHYRDSVALLALFSVPILLLSRLILAARSFFCPDFATIETQLHFSFFFLSRFAHFRDTIALLALFSVPIRPLSRLILAAHSFFCPDSATIETQLHCSLSFLSLFAHYRDSVALLALFSVPILATIETQLHCSLSFLSLFAHYRDSVALLALFSVPIRPLSRLSCIARSLFCPDSPTIETHFGCPLFFLSRFCHY